MALRIIEGVPGAGKTYWAVQHVLHKYYRWDDRASEFVRRKEHAERRVFTNIASMRLGEDLEQAIRKAARIGDDDDIGKEALEAFFSFEFQKDFARDGEAPCSYIIDEAQIYFDRKLWSKTLFTFFQKHRHLGCDVYLITQDVFVLAEELRRIAELYVRAVPRSMNLGKSFRYQRRLEPKGHMVGQQMLRQDPRVFALYRSMMASEGERIPSVLARLIVFGVLLAAAVVVGFMWFAYSFFGWVPPGMRSSGSPASTTVPTSDELRGPAVSRELVQLAQVDVPVAARALSSPFTLGRRVVVRGIAGEVGLGVVLLESLETAKGARPAIERVQWVDALLRCRCDPASLRSGAEVQLWDTAEPRDGAERLGERSGVAPSLQRRPEAGRAAILRAVEGEGRAGGRLTPATRP